MGGAGRAASSWSVLVPTVQTVQKTVEILQVLSLVVLQFPQVQFLDKLFFDCRLQHIDKVVDVPVVTQRQVPRHMGGLREAFGRISTHLLCAARAVHTENPVTLFLRAPVLATLAAVFMRQSTLAFGRISCLFLREGELRSCGRFSWRCSHKEIWTLFQRAALVTVWSAG